MIKSEMSYVIHNESESQFALHSAKQLIKYGFLVTFLSSAGKIEFVRNDKDGQQIRRFVGPNWQLKSIMKSISQYIIIRKKIKNLEYKIYQAGVVGIYYHSTYVQNLCWQVRPLLDQAEAV